MGMIESGVSLTRAIFAFNSANVEGWGLYAEAIMRPYLPLEGQMISLQYRLMRAQTELRLRDDFDQQAFHDFVLAQGLLLPDILMDAVVNDFVPSQLN